MNEKENYHITIKLKVTNMERTDALEDYVTKKINSLEKFVKHFQKDSHDLIFETELEKTTKHHRHGYVYRAEINFTAGGRQLRAEATHEDIYAAIDEVKGDLQREMRKHTEKHIDLVRAGKAKIKSFLKGLG